MTKWSCFRLTVHEQADGCCSHRKLRSKLSSVYCKLRRLTNRAQHTYALDVISESANFTNALRDLAMVRITVRVKMRVGVELKVRFRPEISKLHIHVL